MAKASKLSKVVKFLKSEGFEVSVTDRTQDEFNYDESVTVRANREGMEVFVDSTGGMKYLTVVVTVDGERVNFTVDEVVEGFGICKTQNDVIRDITALISKADEIKDAEIAEAIDEAIEALDAVEVVRTEGEYLSDTVKEAFPHLQVTNGLTTINNTRPELTNYNFDVIKTTNHTVTIRVYQDSIRVVMFSPDGSHATDILDFNSNQHYEVLQALEKHFPVLLTAETLENDGFEVTTSPDEAIYITPEGLLISGEFDCGVRGVDHRCIGSYVPVESYDDSCGFWNHVHNVLGLVRLVPETMTALIGNKQALTKVQIDTLMSSGYQIEAY